ncbi:MAG: hypothetical protein ACI97A_003857 [Planctomycetota bacterium]|jgi:hypothetical protein
MLSKTVFALVLCCLFLVACGGETQEDPTKSTDKSPAAEAKLMLDAAPANPVAVKDMKDDLAAEGDVVVFGRIREFYDGFSGFTLVDQKMRHCAERPGDMCKTPWDYCCEDAGDMVKHSVTVEVHKDGRIIKSTLDGLGGMDKLKDVVVRGKASKDKQGNVVIIADGIFVRNQ